MNLYHFVWLRPVFETPRHKHQNMPQNLQLRITCKQGKSKSKSRSVRAGIGQVLPPNSRQLIEIGSCTKLFILAYQLGRFLCLTNWQCDFAKTNQWCYVWCGAGRRWRYLCLHTIDMLLSKTNHISSDSDLKPKDVWEGTAWAAW